MKEVEVVAYTIWFQRPASGSSETFSFYIFRRAVCFYHNKWTSWLCSLTLQNSEAPLKWPQVVGEFFSRSGPVLCVRCSWTFYCHFRLLVYWYTARHVEHVHFGMAWIIKLIRCGQTVILSLLSRYYGFFLIIWLARIYWIDKSKIQWSNL